MRWPGNCQDITEHGRWNARTWNCSRAAEGDDPGAMSLRSGQRVSADRQRLADAGTGVVHRPGSPTLPVIGRWPRRMGIDAGHRAVRILFDTWAVLMAAALGTPAPRWETGQCGRRPHPEGSTHYSPGSQRPWNLLGSPSRASAGDSDYVH